jgi:hypothetical protein
MAVDLTGDEDPSAVVLDPISRDKAEASETNEDDMVRRQFHIRNTRN